MVNIEHVIFDMGNVLMTFDGPAFSRAFTENEEDANLLQNALFGRPEWALLDAGAIDHATMLRIAKAHLAHRLHPALEACFEQWPEHSEPLAGVCELAQKLVDAGIDIYLLSNASTTIDRQIGRCPVNDLFAGRVVSGFEHMMKPDPAIYRLLCERYGLHAGSCLFIDDNADNCTGAEVAGMQSYRFDGDLGALERTLASRISLLRP